MRAVRWITVGLAILVGSLLVMPVSAQNFLCVTLNGNPVCSIYGFPLGTKLTEDAANILALKNGTSPQTLHVYGGADSAPATTTLAHVFIGDSTVAGQTGAGGNFDMGNNFYYSTGYKYRVTGVAGKVSYNSVAAGCWSILTALSGSADAAITFAEAMRLCAAGITAFQPLFLTSPAITVGSGTGITVNNTGEARDPVYKVTVDKSAFICNAVTCDVTIGTLPANTRLLQVDASLTTTFACTATCTTSTLSMVLGKGSGGAEYLASFDADAATAWFGDADAELGTLMVRAAAINGGTFTTGSQAVVVRLTSGTGNVGTGAATNLSQGSVTFYLHTLTMP